jgi:hypothetical protein
MFNALKYNEILRKAGWDKDQATGLLEVVSDMADQNFATKKDLEIISTEIRKDMQITSSNLQKDMDIISADLRKDIQIISSEIRSEFKTEIQRLDNKIDSVADKIVIRLGTLIVGVATIMSLINQNH